jgi:sulfite dehydrogenase (cytochrome) subunit B
MTMRTETKLTFTIVALGLAGLSTGRAADTKKWTLPPETAAFAPGRGVAAANAHCVTCHSIDYVTTQPPMPRSFWQATVEKMRGKFGAPIPPEQTEPLVEYLTAQYGAKPAVADAPKPGGDTAAEPARKR